MRVSLYISILFITSKILKKKKKTCVRNHNIWNWRKLQFFLKIQTNYLNISHRRWIFRHSEIYIKAVSFAMIPCFFPNVINTQNFKRYRDLYVKLIQSASTKTSPSFLPPSSSPDYRICTDINSIVYQRIVDLFRHRNKPFCTSCRLIIAIKRADRPAV